MDLGKRPGSNCDLIQIGLNQPFYLQRSRLRDTGNCASTRGTTAISRTRGQMGRSNQQPLQNQRKVCSRNVSWLGTLARVGMAKANEQVASTACDGLALMEEFRVKGQQVPLRAVHRLCHQVEICPTCASVRVCVRGSVHAHTHSHARARYTRTHTHTRKRARSL